MFKFLMLLLLAVSVCSADVINIDFGGSAFSGATGQTSYTVPFSPGNLITLTASDLLPGSAKLQWTSGVGIGVGPWESDEIGFLELLQVSFAPPGNVGNFTVNELYWKSGDKDSGVYQLNGTGPWIPFNGIDATGIATVIIGSEVQSIKFATPVSSLGSDYALRGMQVSVPDGGMTLMLLGGVLVGLETLRRKFRV